MRIVLDTNVFVSGVFFTGPPFRILTAWRDGEVTPVLSLDILAEYRRVAEELAGTHRDVDLEPFLTLAAIHGELVDAPPLRQQVTRDPADDKFLACALAARVRIVISGDRDLLAVSGWREIIVLTPRLFVDQYLRKA